MKTISDLLLLGDHRLYLKCESVLLSDQNFIDEWVADLHAVMQDVRKTYGFGRAIAAPQLGVMKRLIYMNIDQPKVFINPEVLYKSTELIEVWDDCMCFPNLLVKVDRHKHIKVRYLDTHFNVHEEDFSDDLSELFQHEYDHLNGVLCTMLAKDAQSFRWRA